MFTLRKSVFALAVVVFLVAGGYVVARRRNDMGDVDDAYGGDNSFAGLDAGRDSSTKEASCETRSWGEAEDAAPGYAPADAGEQANLFAEPAQPWAAKSYDTSASRE